MALSRSSSEMNGAAFPSPTAEMAEINRIHYDLEYTEGISQQMRVPEMLKYSTDDQEKGFFDAPHSVMMHVPERIVVAGDGDDSQFPRPRDLDLIQSTPLEGVALKTPPRVLTLNERPLDFLEMERSSAPSQPTEEVRSHGRLRRERSASENTATRQNGQLPLNDSMCTLTTMDTTLEGGPDDMAVVDATTLRRQIIKLNRRLQLLEDENKERVKREKIMYSITVAFWLINTWVWFRR
ncbi:mitochondrial fission factor homolog B isoform X5 [Alosa alosa]|uniref:mitochondrial fission factor homolog B isoform X5 n=1 Tax=Alosa sapidissima TaxID=34773 RepID=UPI001C093803|nr:mitochondrial fission factor homolog B isoform X5 [Alosa sapidissima]XP_048120673.1 mitochondrial fission factor homolog B isoform X5 [Alosa alosa]